MNLEQRSFLRSLRQQHRLLWLLLGTGVALFLCSKLVQGGALSIGLLVGLLVAYGFSGQWAANLVARVVSRRPGARPTVDLFVSSAKVGAFLSLLSLLFHLGLVVVLDRGGVPPLISQAREPILLRATILPLLACLGAACTVTGMTRTGSIGRQRNDGFLPADEPAPSLSHPVRSSNPLAGLSPRATHTSHPDPRVSRSARHTD